MYEEVQVQFGCAGSTELRRFVNSGWLRCFAAINRGWRIDHRSVCSKEILNLLLYGTLPVNRHDAMLNQRHLFKHSSLVRYFV